MERLIFDSHAHYDDKSFAEDRDEILTSLPEKGICGIINAASHMKSAERCIKLAEKYSFIWAAVGVHPHSADKMTEHDIETLRTMLTNPRVVSVGEIGLDYHYDFSPRDGQKKWFGRQLKLAVETKKPVIIHDREAHGDTLAFLQEYKPKGVVHCFSGSVMMAREVLKLGMYIGLGGAVTFKNAKQPIDVAAEVPLDRLVLETDAPYMTPVPFRGKRCDSAHIMYTAEKIAEIKGISVKNLLTVTKQNACDLFSVNI